MMMGLSFSDEEVLSIDILCLAIGPVGAILQGTGPHIQYGCSSIQNHETTSILIDMGVRDREVPP